MRNPDDAADPASAATASPSETEERALRAMFAALVEDADPSELSALQVQRAAKAEQRAGLDRRIKRLKFARNALVAAVLAGVVALVLPHLGGSRSNTASSSSSAAGTSDARKEVGGEYGAAAGNDRPDQASAPAAAQGPAGAGPMSSSAAAASSAASPHAAAGVAGPATSGVSGMAAGAGAAATSGTAATQGSSAGSSSGSSSSSAAHSAAASGGATARISPCVELPAGFSQHAAAVLAGYHGTVTVVGCARQSRPGSGSGEVTFALTRAAAGACSSASPRCVPVPNETSTYTSPGVVFVYGRGLAVEITGTAPAPDRAALVAAARALLRSVG